MALASAQAACHWTSHYCSLYLNWPPAAPLFKTEKDVIRVCVCNPWSHRDPFGVLHFCKQQGALGACVRREPTKTLTQCLCKRTCFGAPGHIIIIIIGRSWWPHFPFNSADLRDYVVTCRLDFFARLASLPFDLGTQVGCGKPQPNQYAFL